jgi:hypothetical protein
MITQKHKIYKLILFVNLLIISYYFLVTRANIIFDLTRTNLLITIGSTFASLAFFYLHIEIFKLSYNLLNEYFINQEAQVPFENFNLAHEYSHINYNYEEYGEFVYMAHCEGMLLGLTNYPPDIAFRGNCWVMYSMPTSEISKMFKNTISKKYQGLTSEIKRLEAVVDYHCLVAEFMSYQEIEFLLNSILVSRGFIFRGEKLAPILNRTYNIAFYYQNNHSNGIYFNHLETILKNMFGKSIATTVCQDINNSKIPTFENFYFSVKKALYN